MFKLFNNKIAPTPRGFYAVLQGTYKGSFFVFIKQELEHIYCITLPEKQILRSPIKDFSIAVRDGVIELIKKLPKNVYNTVEEEFIKLNNINGLSRTEKNNKPYKRVTSRA